MLREPGDPTNFLRKLLDTRFKLSKTLVGISTTKFGFPRLRILRRLDSNTFFFNTAAGLQLSFELVHSILQMFSLDRFP